MHEIPNEDGTQMHLSVIGCGYLGAVHATCMASLGHTVVGYDVDSEKIKALSSGVAPFFEPGLNDLLASMVRDGRLSFSSEASCLEEPNIHFLCVGTPQESQSHAADLSYLWSAVEELQKYLTAGDVVVGKSTVPVGTAQQVSDALRGTEPTSCLVWNPEFLREGFAVQDTLKPDRIVYGLSGQEHAARGLNVINEVYAPLIGSGVPVVETDYATAELVKVAANSFLATKISFINAMAEICEATGADVTELADAIGYDARIGRRFLNAGVGFGGGCLPKDIRAFIARTEELGASESVVFLREVDAINARCRVRTVGMAVEMCGGSVEGKRIAVLGLAFKPNSDDIRDSPSLEIANELTKRGANVSATDPEALPNVARSYPSLSTRTNWREAVAEADLVILLTEWEEYLSINPTELKQLVQHPRILDGRNVLDAAAWINAGWVVRALGRPDWASQALGVDERS